MKPLPKALLFCLLVLVALQGLSFLYDRYCIADATSKIYWVLRKEKGTYDIVFLGSSRSQSNFNGEHIEKDLGIRMVNIGNGGSSPIDQYLLLSNFLEQGNKTDQLVLTLDDDGLESSSYTQPFQYYSFLPFYDRPVNRDVIHDYLGWHSWLYYIPFFKYAEFNSQIGFINLFNLVRDRHSSFDAWGCKLRDEPFVDQPQPASTIRMDAIMKKYLLKTIELCRQHHIAITLIYPPDHPSIRKARTNREEVLAYYKDVAGEKKVDLIRFDLDDRFQGNENFRDARHLNKKGATLFSEIVVKLLRNQESTR